GLEETRWREWLLELEFRKRETFAYCCEAYSRILAQATGASERCELVEELAESAVPDDDRIDAVEYLDILREATAARNEWRRILARCAPAPRRNARKAVQGRPGGAPVPSIDPWRTREGRPG